MFKNQKGFTLIEAIITLSITGVLYFISVPNFLRLYDYIKLNQAISVLQSDLLYIKELNMLPLENNSFSIRIYHQQNYYLILQNASKVKLKRTLPQGVRIPNAAQITDIKFNANGHISSGKTLTIQSEQFKKNIVFSIGTGGMDIRDAN